MELWNDGIVEKKLRVASYGLHVERRDNSFLTRNPQRVTQLNIMISAGFAIWQIWSEFR
jgi:hypothetical protein